jgi:hypothetical protein
MSLVSERRDLRLVAVVFATITLAFVALLAFATRAQAAETIYWNNYNGTPDNVAFADITGSGGGLLNLGSATLEGPEGMAYDTVTNRLFVGSDVGPQGEILAINLDGSGATTFTAPGALIDNPEGIAIDPGRRTIYWVNTTGDGSIGWAKLDGSAGGLLNTAGATIDSPYRGIAVDTVGGRVYWSNSDPEPEVISYANADGTGGGGNLDLGAAPAPEEITGLAVDPAGGRIYWLDNEEEKIGYASLAPGGNGGEVNLTGATFDDPYGFAFDPSIGRFYLGNYGNSEDRTNAIGVVNLAGSGGGITPATAPVAGPQDPLVIKSPTGTGAPTIIRNATVRSELTCSTGSWAADYAGSFVYQAPRSFAYQWSRNGAAVPGATAATLNATTPGTYACAVTATNHVGSAAQSSGTVNVKASKVKLSTKKKAKADPGDLVTFKVKAVNQGDIQSKNARICVKLPNAAKDDLRKPKCKKLGKLSGTGKRTATIKVKVKGGADEGTDKLTFQVKGTPGKAAKSKIIVR